MVKAEVICVHVCTACGCLRVHTIIGVVLTSCNLQVETLVRHQHCHLFLGVMVYFTSSRF